MPLKDPEKRRRYQTEYMRTTWYPKNRKLHIARVNKLKEKLSSFLNEIKRLGACADCKILGRKYPIILDFDHRGNKSFNIGNFRKHVLSIKSLEKEMAKCDLVCSNCHRIRTYKRNEKVS